MKITFALFLLPLMLLVGCGPDADTPLTVIPPPPTITGKRFSVSLEGVFADDLAYNERRGIYVIRDNNTGQEYVGISGVGISELGSHTVGKTTQADER